ncbi:hypothetical protein C7377_1009 [Balneicella halophila]|uniref:Uncharacterized protein n=2 Tax=Balneicella halophila TaxID=1537566 RepID=A0A7L4UPF8_BALHA|nr:hypothetical protein C7377_1009 [Balneicella halophila]
MLFFGCVIALTAVAQEEHSGLLLTKGNKTKLIRLGKKVKLRAGSDNTIYRAKLIAVDKDFAYLSTGQRVPIKSIKSAKRKRIMFRDVGNASAVTGVWLADADLDADDESDFYDANNYTNTVEEDLADTGRNIVITLVLAVSVGVVVGVVGVLVGIFEPNYFTDQWMISPHNPMPSVFIIKE